jgi:iron complex transport system substrate-binding protein
MKRTTRCARGRRGVIALSACFALISALPPAALFATGTVEIAPTRTVVDALGRTVEVPEDPRRIVAAGNAVLMIADALYLFPGASDRIVGIGRINQGKGNFLAALDPDYGEKAVLERNVGPEQIAGLSPDVVIIKSFLRERLGDGIERLGIPVVYVDLETPEQYQRDLVLLGDVLGQPARGRELADYYERETDRARRAVETAIEGGAKRPATLFLYADVTGGETVFNVPPRGWIQTTLVEVAGGHPVWLDGVTGGGWTRVGLEQIAAWNPEVITLVAYRQDVSAVHASLLDNPAASRLAAVANRRFHVFPLDFYSWDQPDVRWILGLKWLAQTLHPDALDIDVVQETYDFFDFAYDMDRDEVNEIIVPHLEGVEP